MKTYPGINIQYPISRLVLDGTKIVETRTYPIPSQYVGKDMAIIETPGIAGKFKARIIGIVRFGESFKYKTKDAFYKDTSRHCVTSKSRWRWQPGRSKWGWPIQMIMPLSKPVPAPINKGIRYTLKIALKVD